MATKAMALRLDQESRLREDDHHSIRVWLRLLTCTSLIEGELRRRLRDEFATTLPRFDLLAQLQRAPAGLSMGELSRRMMVSGGNVSGIATQLEREGLIAREAVPGNRRSFCVTLTSKGERRFARMAERHEEWVIDLLAELPRTDVERLMSVLEKLKRGLTRRAEED